MSKIYGKRFFEEQSEGSIRSAEIIVPRVLSLFSVSSVVDIGCGVGGWLSVFEKNGIHDYIGIDGDYISREALKIPAERFQPEDLVSLKNVGRKFDLACSLEVAEHLPEQVAEQFVEALVGAAPVILFSAAIPNQGGTNHINEQWQSYWFELFLHHNYHAFDCIRPSVYGDEQVKWWYRQNCIIYCDIEHSPIDHDRIMDPYLLNRVDPEMIDKISLRCPYSWREAILLIWKCIHAIRKAAMKRL